MKDPLADLCRNGATELFLSWACLGAKRDNSAALDKGLHERPIRRKNGSGILGREPEGAPFGWVGGTPSWMN